jgi:hypothetical protein
MSKYLSHYSSRSSLVGLARCTVGLMALLIGVMSSQLISAGERESQIKRCQIIKDKIEYYTDMRRGGGSSSQMRSWQAQRNDYKQRYRDENCTRVRSALKSRR